MPTRPLRSCSKSGCPTLVTKGCCAEHKPFQRKIYDQERGTAAARGYDSDWEKGRKAALERDRYLCLHCLANGRAEPAKDVDHILPIATHPQLRLELSNLQSLCRACHVIKTATDNQN